MVEYLLEYQSILQATCVLLPLQEKEIMKVILPVIMYEK